MKHREKKEFQGKDLEDVIGEAEEYFEVSKDELAYRVIKGKTSFFGKERKIFISAWVKDKSEEEELKKFLEYFKGSLSLSGNFNLTNAKGDILIVDYQGDDSYIFTENHGELLNDSQYLLNRLFPFIGKRIVTDADGYRRKRESYLRRLARRIAERVRETGQEELLFPMGPNERRIIHMVVNSMDGVTSKSEEEGYLKRVRVTKMRHD